MSKSLLSRRVALKFTGLFALASRDTLWMLSDANAPSPVTGYGMDPNLVARPVTWPRTLDPVQLRSLAAISSIILPADPPHLSADAIGVHYFLDEWLSAPYPQMQADRTLVLDGLKTLDESMRRERGLLFAHADLALQSALFEMSCDAAETRAFAQRIIELVCSGYYTTREGHAAIGYVGNVPLQRFPPPSEDIVAHFVQALSEIDNSQE